jgi:hypothetical protein
MQKDSFFRIDSGLEKENFTVTEEVYTSHLVIVICLRYTGAEVLALRSG